MDEPTETTEKPIEKKRTLKIDRRSIQVATVPRDWKRKGKDIQKDYSQYKMTIPKEFAEQHGLEQGGEVYLVSDGIGIFIPDQEKLMRILLLIPELTELAHTGEIELTDEQMGEVVLAFPQLKDYIMKNYPKVEDQK